MINGITKTIHIVEDEPDIRETLAYNLSQEGFKVSEFSDAESCLNKIQKKKPDLLLLDLMLPGMSGLDLCKEIRADINLKNLAIIMLTAKGEEVDRIIGFELGADDYVTKPIKPKLLISRINALLKRNKKKEKQTRIKIGDIEVDKTKHLLLYKNEEMYLARKEFNLLYYLMTIPGKVFTREEIITNVWKDTFVGDRTIDVHIRKIREKIGAHHIRTIKGVGYKFDI